MKFRVAAAVAIALAMAATTASAGVVISQELGHNDPLRQAGESKTERTVMIQGHKQKVIDGERQIITDMDAGKIIVINPKRMEYVEVPFPPNGLLAMRMVWDGSTIPFKKTGSTNKVAGYQCSDYAGDAVVALHNFKMTECVASDAPGAKEFVDYQKELALKLKSTHLLANGEIPDGMPVSSTSTIAQLPFVPPKGMSPEAAKKIQDDLARYKPTVKTMTVTKIEVKDLPADTFTVPAGYTKGVAKELPNITLKRGMSAPGPLPAPQGSAVPPAQ